MIALSGSAEASPWSLRADISSEELSLSADYVAFTDEQSWVGVGVSLAKEEVFDSIGSSLQWTRSLLESGSPGALLLSVVPSISYKMADFEKTMLWPGVLVQFQFLREWDFVGVEALQENWLSLVSEFDSWSGRRREIRGYWGSIGRSPELRLGLLARAEEPAGVVAVGPELYVSLALSDPWSLAVSGFLSRDWFESGLQVNWQNRRDLSLYLGISRSVSPTEVAWDGNGGVSWFVN